LDGSHDDDFFVVGFLLAAQLRDSIRAVAQVSGVEFDP
jgi:hypothetical protein